MALSDCPKCWSTPCTCGEQYKHMERNERKNLADKIYPEGKNNTEHYDDYDGSMMFAHWRDD